MSFLILNILVSLENMMSVVESVEPKPQAHSMLLAMKTLYFIKYFIYNIKMKVNKQPMLTGILCIEKQGLAMRLGKGDECIDPRNNQCPD